MTGINHFVGFTDTGQPLVLAEGGCEHFRSGSHRLLAEESCWYCRYADFRKTVDATLSQSICRCPQNTVCILSNAENEQLRGIEEQGGERHA